MSKSIAGCVLAFVLGLTVLCRTGHAQSGPDITGTWTGTAYQNEGASGYTVILTITPTSAASQYPELRCEGTMTRIAASGDYVFFAETIVPSRPGEGGSCINGTVTVAPAGDKLAWGWFGSFQGKAYVAWGLLAPKE